MKTGGFALTEGERAKSETKGQGSEDWGQGPMGGCRMCLAIPGKIVEISADNPVSALVDVAGVRRPIDLTLLQEDKAIVGDWVLIHVGFAMSKISEQDALEQMNTLRLLGVAEEAVQEVRGLGLDDVPAGGSGRQE
jgi:hydrogenase expression/formation protein HypC